MPADSFNQIVQAVHELVGGGVRGELLGEPACVLPAVGCPAGAGGFERGEADGVGVQGAVGAPGGGFVGAGSPQHVEHGVHALDRRRGDHGVAEVDVQRRGLADEEVPESGRGLDQPCLPVVLGCCGAPGRGEETVDDLVEKVVLVADVPVERHRRDTESGRQAADRHLLVAACPDDLDGDPDDVFPGDRPPGRPARRGRGVLPRLRRGPALFPHTRMIREFAYMYASAYFVYMYACWLTLVALPGRAAGPRLRPRSALTGPASQRRWEIGGADGRGPGRRRSRGPGVAAAARPPLTSVASAVEMTGDYTLTLPVMLATATATSARSATATIYTTKLLRRGYDIDRAAPGGPSATSRPPARCA